MPDVLPIHVGFILDGNRRWAKAQGLPTLEGHRVGYNNLKDIGKAAIRRGIKFVSAYIFSTENWSRTKSEVKYLMDLAYRVVTKDVEELHRDNIKVVWLGSKDMVSEKLLQAIKQAEELTKANTRGTLALCFNYGGWQEIADAARCLAEKGNAITPQTIRGVLYHPEVPDLDLIIRSSGERRISNYMLWRAAYAELYFTDKHWPAFTEEDLDKALQDYANRQRRFGS